MMAATGVLDGAGAAMPMMLAMYCASSREDDALDRSEPITSMPEGLSSGHCCG
jgi:hypothetical protein